MKKSGFLSFLIISLSLAAFFAGYIMVKRGADITSKTKTGTILDKFGEDQPAATADPNQPAEAAKPVLLTEKRVVSPVNSLNKGEVMYFEKNTGKLFKLNLETKSEQPVLDKVLLNFVSAIWSPSKKAIIGTFVSGSRTYFKYFNIDTEKEVSFDPGVRSIAFSPDGTLVVYHYLDSAASQSLVGKLVMSDPDGESPKTVLNTRLEDIKLSWPTKDNIAITNLNSEVFVLNDPGKLTKVLELKVGLEQKWSPSGNKLLFSTSSTDADQPNSVLNIKDMESKEERVLVPGSASKCTWSIDDINVYCSVSKTPSIDEIYQVNTLDGSRKLVAEPFVQIKELLLSPAEDNLLFINASDEKLYSINISD